jgi:hypothetical protein
LYDPILLLKQIALQTGQITKASDNDDLADSVTYVPGIDYSIFHHGADLLERRAEDIPDILAIVWSICIIFMTGILTSSIPNPMSEIYDHGGFPSDHVHGNHNLQ